LSDDPQPANPKASIIPRLTNTLLRSIASVSCFE
jgi:hypothetical protein